MWLFDRLQQVNRTTLTVAGIVLAIVLFLAVNMLAALVFPTARIDLTKDQLFTVTPSTQKVLEAVKEPITLHVYQSSALIDSAPSLRVFSQRVNEILRTYEELSGGKVRVDRVDPISFSQDEDRALGYDLQGIQLNQSGDRGYFGLVGTNTVDQVETIKFFDPARESFLEYDLTRIVNRLSAPSAPKVGIIDGLGMFGDAQQKHYPTAMLQLINRNFDIQQINMDVEALPDNLNGLVIVHPYALTPRAAYAVDQYVLNGGPALVFIDPLAENSAPNPQKPQEPMFPASNLPELMKAWGIEMPADKVVGDRDMALRITGSAGGRTVTADYLPWLQVRKDQLNPTDVVTSQLTIMRVGSAGTLLSLPGAQTAFTPLITSTPNSMLFNQIDIKSRPAPNVLLDKFKASGVRQTIAARVTGPANTAFPGGQPPPNPNAQPDQQKPPPAPPKPQLTHSIKPINIIVVADTDILNDTYVINDSGQVNSNNSDFVMNALDNLTGGSALLGLRGRGLSFRPFTTIEAMESKAQSQYQATEETLQKELDDAQQQLQALQNPDQNGQPTAFQTLTQAQQETVANANRKILQLRQQLRDVRAALNAEIDKLETSLKFLNILLVPVIVVAIGILIAGWRRYRLARYLKRQATA